MHEAEGSTNVLHKLEEQQFIYAAIRTYVGLVTSKWVPVKEYFPWYRTHSYSSLAACHFLGSAHYRV